MPNRRLHEAVRRAKNAFIEAPPDSSALSLVSLLHHDLAKLIVTYSYGKPTRIGFIDPKTYTESKPSECDRWEAQPLTGAGC
jgi:hypothetical protein